MSSFTFQAQNGGDGREYHLSHVSLYIMVRKRQDRESRTGRNDRLLSYSGSDPPPFVTETIFRGIREWFRHESGGR